VAGAKRRPSIKLTWREEVLHWVNVNRHELPEGVSRPAAHAVVGMLMQAADEHGRNVIASSRWIERETGVHHLAAADLVEWLVEHRWLEGTGRVWNRTPMLDLVPQVRRDLPHPEDTSGEASGEASGEDYSHTTVTTVTTRKTSPKREQGFRCSNCGQVDGHDQDCAYRPFDDLIPEPEPVRCSCVGLDGAHTAGCAEVAISNLGDLFDVEVCGCCLEPLGSPHLPSCPCPEEVPA
jgi:hypothetical protein